MVRPSEFSLEGRAIRKVRQSVARVERRGWRVDVVDGLLPGGPLGAELDALERAWCGRRPRLQGFAMCLGRLWGAPEDARAVYVVARRPDGTLSAFLRFVRCGEGLSLDVMRRLPSAPNGVNERMIYEMVEWGRSRGVDEVSLNFAALRTFLTEQDEQAWTWLIRSFEGRLGLQMDTLRRFNEKFRPRWVPRRIAFRSPVDLPAIALATLSAEGFLPFDSGRSPAPAMRAS